MPKLMWLFLTPFLTSLIAFASSFVFRKKIKVLAVIMSLLPMLILIFSSSKDLIGNEVNFSWIPTLSISFHLKLDELSLLFVYLTVLIIPISLLTIPSHCIPHANVLYGFILLLQGLLIGFFTASNLALFAIFWEAMLFPLYFIIALWGGAKRQVAALKFIIYMVAGSALMIAAVLSLYFAAAAIGKETFDLEVLAQVAPTVPYLQGIFIIFALAFAVKTPLFPFHGWLPDAYYEAPTVGTILLSALLSKAGIYGFLRIGLGLFPTLMQAWSPWLLGLAITGVLYGGLAAWRQNDYKRLMAYSSFSHVNFILAGLFVWSSIAHQGVILQAINHGITITALFLVAGYLQKRLQTTAIGPYHGIAKFMPQLCWLTLVFVLSSVALPGTNNFIGELMILFGLYEQSPLLAGLLGLTVILSVIYMLRFMQKIYFEEASPFQHQWMDLKKKELLIALPLIVLIFWIGLYPKPLLEKVAQAERKIMSIDLTEKS